MKPLFIGYDTREPIAFHVCSNSIIRHATCPIAVVPLAQTMMPFVEIRTDQSNQFTYSRFLVPYFQNFKGWAVFIDGDMIVKEDITKLWELADQSKAVLVVKHDYKTSSFSKYLGSKNENYPRKNWSSVVLWNCEHPANKMLTPEFIQASSGNYLHRFQWLDDQDIGELPVEWNWLTDEFGINNAANLIHYTLGTPCFNKYRNSPMSDFWHREYTFTTYFQDDKPIN